ncbi:MAG TPA: hypothetical protein VGA22_11015 [Gemmatimonadales bacterium]|jgi:hypothetical protein
MQKPWYVPNGAAVVLFVACTEASVPPPVTVTTRDSVGIVIVENRMDTAEIRSGWALGGEPLLTIGGVDAPESQQLFRVSGARRLADGRVAVVDGGEAELRIYDARGRLERTHGRRGEGPGEFESPVLAGLLTSDSLVVYDSRLRRASVLHVDGGYARSYLIGEEGGGYPVVIGIAENGGLAMGGGMRFSSAEGFPTGLVRPNSRYVVLTPEGGVRGDLGDVPAAEMFARTGGGTFQASTLPFGRRTVAAAGHDHLWLGTGDAWEINVYTMDATLTRVVRFDRARQPVTAELRAAYLAERLADVDDEAEARAARASVAELPIPGLVPPYDHVMLDALGDVWIGEYLLPGQLHRTYTIVDAHGSAIGRLTLPSRTRPLDIGPDYVLAQTLDELDVERLTLWRLDRP